MKSALLFLSLVIVAFMAGYSIDFCPVDIGDEVDSGRVVAIHSTGAGTRNCFCQVMSMDGTFSGWVYAFKIINKR